MKTKKIKAKSSDSRLALEASRQAALERAVNMMKAIQPKALRDIWSLMRIYRYTEFKKLLKRDGKPLAKQKGQRK